MTDVPVRPELIVWAREHRGLNQQEAAEKLGVAVADLDELERGEKAPNLTFFRKLSSRFKIPSGTLLRQTPPAVPAMPTDFRTIEGRPPEIGFETRLAVSYARTISENILELLENDLTPAIPRLPRIHVDQNAEEAGEAERERLNVGAIQQIGWARNQAFRNWRSVIEAAGTYVLLKKFPLEDCKGFTIFDDVNAPMIVISKVERLDVARTFTLIHEYAHLLLREPGLSDHDERNPIESYCNRFAAAFLMPRAVIRQLIGGWPNDPQDWDYDDIRNWANRLKVSQQSLALRFEGLGIARQGFYNRFRRHQRPAEPPRQGEGGNYVSTQINELGDRFARAVLDAERIAGILPAEASDMLDIRPAHFERVRQQITNQDNRVGVG